MKLKQIFGLLIPVAIFLTGCGECEKLNLSQAEKDWVNHFKKGQKFYYKNIKGQIDTVEITETRDFYTPCNKFELSEYQYEVYDASFVIKSVSKYNNNESLISFETSSYKPRVPNIFFGNLGTHRNDLENKMPKALDTVLGGVKFNSIYYYARGLNTENYGNVEFFKNFFWDKQSGLVAYTTVNNELFLRVNK